MLPTYTDVGRHCVLILMSACPALSLATTHEEQIKQLKTHLESIGIGRWPYRYDDNATTFPFSGYQDLLNHTGLRPLLPYDVVRHPVNRSHYVLEVSWERYTDRHYYC